MKLRLLALVLTLWLPLTGNAQALQAPAPQDITFMVMGYEIAKRDAAAIFQTLDVKVDAQALIAQATKAHAKPTKLATVKARSGTRAAVREQGAAVELEAILGADGTTILTVLMLSEGKSQLRTEVVLADGVVAFLGTLEEPGKDAVKLVFIRAALSAGGP